MWCGKRKLDAEQHTDLSHELILQRTLIRLGADDEWLKYKADKRAFVVNVQDFSPLEFNYIFLNHSFKILITLGALYSHEFYQNGCHKINTRNTFWKKTKTS